MRNGKAKIIRSGEISKTLRLKQSKETFEIQILYLIKKNCLMLMTNCQRRFSHVLDKISSILKFSADINNAKKIIFQMTSR